MLIDMRLVRQVQRPIARQRAVWCKGTQLAAGETKLYQSFCLLNILICNLLKTSPPIILLYQLNIASCSKLLRSVQYGCGATSAIKAIYAFFLYS